ncbi:MAG: methionine gamma-lyase family protein, partial [Oscillospiraceae bacterium]|nr:methionine gamma-lyase family protein [Oscillospiraceae bacterium]
YDTIQSVIGVTGNYPGTLQSYGIHYGQVELTAEGKPNLPAIQNAIKEPQVKVAVIQRSRGYATRDSFSVTEIGAICDAIHTVRKDVAILVDNCYGEFVEELEPTDVGADLVMGSLIKNPGGGLAPMGGYLAGRHDLIEGAAMRLTVPGIGKECGATLGNNRSLYQGLFLAPHVTAQAVKTALFAARMMELLGYQTSPASTQTRYDIIQMIHFGAPEPLKRFCRGIQLGAPVDSYVTPEPWDMPGYDSQVIMAAGAFIQGSSIELSADGPMRNPYTAYLQGGLTYESGRLGIMLAVDALLA